MQKEIAEQSSQLKSVFDKQEKLACLRQEFSQLVTEQEYFNQYVKEYQGYCLEAFKTKFNNGFNHLKEDLKLIGKLKSIEANFCFDGTDKKILTCLIQNKVGL